MRRDIDRLMLLLPPRHGKTELASRRYPPFSLGNFPTRQVIAASASESFATDVGREVRNIIRSEEYGRIFPGTVLSDDSAAAGRWHTKQGGIFYAVGVGSQILGKGADEFIIDDPFGSMADAQSETTRKSVREWYQGSVYNRLQPGGAIILINHRMHEDDLSGYLIEQQNHGGDKWEIVELPAIDSSGAALWPEAYPIESLERIRANSLPRFWSALYQQNPQPDEGTFFKREWFERYDKRPNDLSIFGASDYAVTDGGGDYTEHGICGVDPDSKIYLLDWWRGQTTSDVWIEQKLNMVKRHSPIAWFGEGGVIQKAIGPALSKRMRQRNDYVRLEWLPSVHDKPTRARSFQALAANGQVALPKTQWADDLIDQLTRFPAGKYDDGVDVCSLIGRAVHEMHPALLTGPVKKKRPADLWDDDNDNDDTQNWKTR
jgi:predicted phage terminase large subunit-like protein